MTHVTMRTLLVAAVVLLAANLVVMLTVNGATPAQAQGAPTCVGISSTIADNEYGMTGYVFRVWSDGRVDYCKATNVHEALWKQW